MGHREDWLATFIPGTGVLANRLGITDADVLREYEAAIALAQEHRIMRGDVAVTRTYGPAHLCALHRHLFGELYEWAGRIRSYPMNKGATWFASPGDIGEYLRAAQRAVHDTEWESLPHDDVAVALARVFAYLNTAHPFREGNGRASKLFVRQLANDHGWDLDYSLVTPEQWNNASAFSGPDLGSFEPVPDTLYPVFGRLLIPLDGDG